MKTITVIAYNRPLYLRRTLAALGKCRGIEGYHVLISCDGMPRKEWFSGNQVYHEANGWRLTYPDWTVIGYSTNHGVNSHPLNTYRLVFERIDRCNSDFNVVIEDDVVPSPDALELCDWFYEKGRFNGPEEYACLLLHAGSVDQSNRGALTEAMRFCPWGWATTREMWERWWKPNWNCKQNHPKGWDWSMGLVIQQNGLKVLRPMLSRTLNIGREGGTYETPSHWDEWASHLVMSDGTPADFEIVRRLPPDYRETMVEDWVRKAEVAVAT